MRRLTSALVLALVVPTVIAAEPVGPTLAWDLLDCIFVYGTATVPAALVASRYPTGFRPFLVQPATAGQLAQLGFEVDVCASGAGLDGQVSPMAYASTWSPVITLPRYQIPGAVGHYLTWEVLVPDDDRRTVLSAAGVPAHDGSVAISTDFAGMSTAPFQVDYAFDGLAAFRFDIVPQPPPPGGPGAGGGGEFAQYVPGEDGTLSFWRTKWATSAGGQGVGTVTLDAGSWQAKALGTTQLPARFSFGKWQYTEGKIVLPE